MENCEIKLDQKGVLESFLECFRKCFGGDITGTLSLYYVCIALFKLTLLIENFKGQARMLLNVCKPQIQRLRKVYKNIEASLGNIRLILSKTKQKLSMLQFSITTTAKKRTILNLRYICVFYFILYIHLFSIYFTLGNVIQIYMKHNHIQLFLPSYKQIHSTPYHAASQLHVFLIW